jgi:hypothetical protein
LVLSSIKMVTITKCLKTLRIEQFEICLFCHQFAKL